MSWLSQWWRLSMLAFLVSGCAQLGAVQPGMEIAIGVADNINPNKQGEPRPVTLRLYELRSDIRFVQADFLALYRNDASVLGQDLVLRHELKPLLPGQARAEVLQLQPDTRHVAILAEFSDYHHGRSKLIFAVSPGQRGVETVQVRIERSDLWSAAK